MLPPRHRLRRKADIRLARQQGRRRYHPLLILYCRQTECETSRFAVAVNRRVGKAVVRNRCKRQVREAIRRHLDEFRGGHDCLLVARNALAHSSFSEIEAAVLSLLQRAGVRRDHE